MGEFVGREPNPVILNVVSDITNIRVEFFLTENDYLSLAREILKNSEAIQERDEDEVLFLSDLFLEMELCMMRLEKLILLIEK